MKDKRAAISNLEFISAAVKVCPKCKTTVIISADLNVVSGCPHVEHVYEKKGRAFVIFAEPEVEDPKVDDKPAE